MLVDALFGDPVYPFHPVRVMGLLIERLEKTLRAHGWSGRTGGGLLAMLVITVTLTAWFVVDWMLSGVHSSLAWGWRLYLGWSLLAGRDLLVHGQRVERAMRSGDLDRCRGETGRMVGRDTKNLDFPACGRAAVESISENLSDGVIAPLFYFLLLGIPGMLAYKAVNTLDSMLGYRNDRYREFGMVSARMDDLLNWAPSRLTWGLIGLAALLLPDCSGRRAWLTGWTEHRRLPSPNAGWCEAAAAGALQIRLCGPIWREGRLCGNHWLGNPDHRDGAAAEDIARVNRVAVVVILLFVAAGLALLGTSALPFAGLGMP